MTESYIVNYSRDALDDLREIYSYIADELLVPDVAVAQVGRIRKIVRSLDFMPARFALVGWEPWHSLEMHQLPVDKLIPEGMGNPGQVYTVSQGKSSMIGVFRLESQMLPGNGKFDKTELGSDGKCKEAANTAFHYLKVNGKRISGNVSTTLKDYIVNY